MIVIIPTIVFRCDTMGMLEMEEAKERASGGQTEYDDKEAE